jgi:hypothetical protein
MEQPAGKTGTIIVCRKRMSLSCVGHRRILHRETTVYGYSVIASCVLLYMCKPSICQRTYLLAVPK